MNEIKTYASERGILPTTVVQNSGAGSGGTWSRWLSGGGCSMKTAEKLRNYMRDNPLKDKVRMVS